MGNQTHFTGRKHSAPGHPATRPIFSYWAGDASLEKAYRLSGVVAIGAATVFYQGLLEAIEVNDYDVFSKRASLTAWGKLSRIPVLWLKLAAL